MFKFFPTDGYKWIDRKEFHSDKYRSNSSEGCFLEVDLECPKNLCELHNDYSLALDKIKILKKLSICQLKIADFYNIHIDNGKKFNKERCLLHYENLQIYLRLGLKLKKALCIRNSSMPMAKTTYQIQHKKTTEAEKKM